MILHRKITRDAIYHGSYELFVLPSISSLKNYLIYPYFNSTEIFNEGSVQDGFLQLQNY
jgi:hypothetical protein